jgi:hypothetical protein
MRVSRLMSGVALSMAFAFAASAAQAASFSVLGSAAVYGAGLTGNGVSTAPYSFDFTAGAGQVLTFSGVTGFTDCCSSLTPSSPPDGSGGSTSVSALNGISGIVAPNQMFLAGVFIDSTNLPSCSGPSGWDYTAGPFESDASFSGIGLNRVFFIGDGLTGSGTGSTQSFNVPVNADRLLLGFVDSYAFSGPPSYYGDNTGSLTGNFSIEGLNVGATPLPATFPLFATGLGMLALLGWRRKKKAAALAAG